MLRNSTNYVALSKQQKQRKFYFLILAKNDNFHQIKQYFGLLTCIVNE